MTSEDLFDYCDYMLVRFALFSDSYDVEFDCICWAVVAFLLVSLASADTSALEWFPTSCRLDSSLTCFDAYLSGSPSSFYSSWSWCSSFITEAI